MKVVNTTMATGYTAVGLAEALLHVTDVPDSKAAVGRVKAILKGLMNLPLTEGRSLITEAVKAAPEAEKATLKVRGSQLRTLYGASKLIPGFEAEIAEAGWNKAIDAARKALDEHRISASGAPVLDKSAKEVIAQKAAELEAIRRVVTKGGTATPEALQKALGEIEAEKFRNAVTNFAVSIRKDKGHEFAQALAGELVRLAMADQTAPKAKAAPEAEEHIEVIEEQRAA